MTATSNTKKIVRSVAEVSNAVNDMHKEMAKVKETAPDPTLEETKNTLKKQGVLYIEPKTRIPTRGQRFPEYDSKLRYLMEYVTGVFESQHVGTKLNFFLAEIPGEPYCEWEIPVNKQIAVPRFVAQHLQKSMGWKELRPLEKGQEIPVTTVENMNDIFSNFDYKKRGHFHPVDSYT